MDTIYHVVVHRRSAGVQQQLNFTDPVAANAAFAALGNLTERKIITDSFGSKVNFDPDDIGHIVFIDAQRVMDLQGKMALMQHNQQQLMQARIDASPAPTAARGIINGAGPRFQL